MSALLQIAQSLSRWQILDMVHLHRTGRAIEYSYRPNWPCQKLLDAKVLAHGGHGKLVPGVLFRSVMDDLVELGRISSAAPSSDT